jgi:TonB-dependent SusC/RagA subfamily outer membrane receptor
MLVFILKSAITLALLYSCFFILLSKETFHRFNRVMLLGIMVAAFVVPMLHITTEHPTIINEEVQLIENMTDRGIVFIYEDEATEPQPQINWVQVMMWVYLTGVAVMLMITLIQVINLVRLMHRGIQQKDEQGNTIILINGEIPPFSIFRFIVMSVKDYESGRQYILTHEQEHIRLGHSYDLLLMQVLKTIQWFNPFVWFISRDLKTIHEYEADQAVINQGIDAKQYQLFLVKKVVGNRLQPFTNNLNHGSLKKRIAMMYQKKSNRWLMLKALFAIPVIALTISAFATPAAMKPVEELVKTIEEQASPSFVLQDEREILANEVSNEPSNLLAPIGETGKGSEGVPDIKPGQVLTGQVTDEKGEPLQTANVTEQDEQGRIYANAVTDINGNFSIKIVSPEHNIRVSYMGCKTFLTKVSNMPKKVVLPPNDLIQIVDVNARKRDVAGGEPLLVVDGVIMQGVEHLDVNEPTSIDVLMLKEFGIKQSDIESVTVLKDGAATAIYGEKGKNGVIEIKTRVKQDTIVARVMNNENGLAIKSNNDDLPLDSMLNRLPGLEKQPDGSFTVNGKKIKRVLVNGEEMNLEDLVK